jgi:hypothetical protein
MTVMMGNDSKQFFKGYLIFFSTIAILALVSFGFVFLARSSWEKGLRDQIQSVLDASYPGEYLAGERLRPGSPPVNIPLLLLLQPKRGMPFEKPHYALILRMATVYGIVPAVFLYEDGGKVAFQGISCYPEAFRPELLALADPQIRRLENLLLEYFAGKTGKGGRLAA